MPLASDRVAKLPNYKNIEVTDDYTKKLEEIQESGFFYRQKRRDFAKRNSKAYGLDLVFPENLWFPKFQRNFEYQEKKIRGAARHI